MRRAGDALAAKSSVTGVQSIAVAELYVRAKSLDRALDWLDKTFDARDPNVAYLNASPAWDDLRGHPRFKNLLQRMNLPM